jgi:hypothetical protein
MAYLNVIEIESALQNLAAAYREVTELVEAPHLSMKGARFISCASGRRARRKSTAF